MASLDELLGGGGGDTAPSTGEDDPRLMAVEDLFAAFDERDAAGFLAALDRVQAPAIEIEAETDDEMEG